MCRLLINSNFLEDGSKIMNYLINKNGGDGDGLIHSDDTIINSKKIKTIDYKINDVNIKKIFYSEPLIFNNNILLKNHTKIYYKPHTKIYDKVIGSWYFYHTRISSTDEVNIMNTHPWIIKNNQRFLVMQNGHEERLKIIGKEADYKAITKIIQKIKDKTVLKAFLFNLTYSNIFIVDTINKEFIIFSNKAHDPLWIKTFSTDSFIVASERVIKGMSKFEGYIEGKLHNNNLEITNQYKITKPKHYYYTFKSNEWNEWNDTQWVSDNIEDNTEFGSDIQ